MPLYVLLLLPTFRGENQVENFQGFYPFACPPAPRTPENITTYRDNIRVNAQLQSNIILQNSTPVLKSLRKHFDGDSERRQFSLLFCEGGGH